MAMILFLKIFSPEGSFLSFYTPPTLISLDIASALVQSAGQQIARRGKARHPRRERFLPASSHDLELLNELVLGSARGGKRQAAELICERVRVLGPEDVELLRAPPPMATKAKSPLHLRHSHHQLARLIAAGKPDHEISLITGYSPSYICSLKDGQDFKELISYYSAQKEMIFVEVMERMKIMGLNTLDEIQRRFEESPEAFTTQQLMDLTDLMIIKPAKIAAEAASSSGSRPGAAAVTVNVQFVRSELPAEALEGPSGGGEILEVVPRVVGAR